MNCEKCSQRIKDGEQRELHGQTLCEDCCMDLLSPAKTCDPWAVYSATRFAKGQTSDVELTAAQSKILQLLKETGGAEPATIMASLRMNPSEYERDIATLRHLERVRGELREGKKFIRLW